MPRRFRRKFRRRAKKKTNTVKKLAKRVKMIEAEIELKELNTFIATNNTIPPDSSTAIPAVTASGFARCLSQGIVVGGTQAQRIGNRITLKSLDLRCYVHGTGTFVNECRVRVMLVKVRNNNGVTSFASFAAGGFSNMFDMSGAIGAAPYTVDTLDTDFRDTFKVLYDKQFDLIPDVALSATVVVPQIKIIRIKRKLGWVQQYNNNAFGDARDINDGSLWLLAFTSAVDAMGSPWAANPYIFFKSDLLYTDA